MARRWRPIVTCEIYECGCTAITRRFPHDGEVFSIVVQTCVDCASVREGGELLPMQQLAFLED